MPRGVLTPLYFVPPPRARGETLLIRSVSCAALIAWQPPPVTPFPFIFLTTHNLRRAGRVLERRPREKTIFPSNESHTRTDNELARSTCHHAVVQPPSTRGVCRRRRSRGHGAYGRPVLRRQSAVRVGSHFGQNRSDAFEGGLLKSR